MYGKLFESCYRGSMVGAGADVFAVWPYVIAHTKKDAIVELNPMLIAATIGMPVENVIRVIEFLCMPDPKSRTKEEDGRRLIKLDDFSYRVVNHPKYRQLQREDNRREYMRQYMQQRRSVNKKANGEFTEGNLPVSVSGSVSDNGEDVEGGRDIPPTLEQCKAYAVAKGLPEIEAEKFWNFYGSKGWKVGKNPMQNWHMAMGGWKSRCEERHLTQEKTSQSARLSAYEITTRINQIKTELEDIRYRDTPKDNARRKDLASNRDKLKAMLTEVP